MPLAHQKMRAAFATSQVEDALINLDDPVRLAHVSSMSCQVPQSSQYLLQIAQRPQGYVMSNDVAVAGQCWVPNAHDSQFAQFEDTSCGTSNVIRRVSYELRAYARRLLAACCNVDRNA